MSLMRISQGWRSCQPENAFRMFGPASIALVCLTVAASTSTYGHPFEATPLPYEGYGYVALLNDGTLLISTGGDEVFDEEGQVLYYATQPPLDRVSYSLDPAALAVVQADRTSIELSITESSKPRLQLKEQDVEGADQPRRTSWGDLVANNATGVSLFAVLEFEGNMVLDVDETGFPSFAITDQRTGETFYVSGAVLAAAKRIAKAVRGDARRADMSANPDGSVAGGGDAVNKAECFATCTNGKCNITCGGKLGARCWCTRGGLPKCECFVPAE